MLTGLSMAAHNKIQSALEPCFLPALRLLLLPLPTLLSLFTPSATEQTI